MIKMKLVKWKCGTCGFEWFEPIKFNDYSKNIDHGCPQGCDDAGKIVDFIEATERKNEWICWILSKEDIDMAYKNVSGSLPSNETYENIVRHFKKGFIWANENWEMVLNQAISEATK
jgi:hypothetical protein